MNARIIPVSLLLTMALASGACRQGSEPHKEPLLAAPENVAVTPPRGAETPAAAASAGVIGFHGFGPARFGDDEELVRMSWGRPLRLSGTAADGCHQLFMEPRPQDGFGISFMLESGVLVRYDIDTDRFQTPEGIEVGSSADEVLAAYPDRVEQQPHKYVEGARYLVVRPAGTEPARFVFEVNPQGRVARWRVGVPPAVHYVEGCA